MINPAILPSELLTQYIGVSENFEIKAPFNWADQHCEQFRSYEVELKQKVGHNANLTLLLDMADELIDSSKTLELYRPPSKVVTFEGGSHGFEHIEDALPIIK